MAIDWDIWLVVLALIAFNAPIAVTGWHFRKLTGVAEMLPGGSREVAGEPGKERVRAPALVAMLQEKAPDGSPSGAISYSRVTGLIGAVVVASLFWIMSNVSIAVAILNPGALADILNGITKLFFVGAALFLPYAFNQLKSLVQ
jgi:hypothetical protein